MTRKYKTASGEESDIHVYIKRYQQLWNLAGIARTAGHSDASAINVIHACISLADAVCIFKTGARYAGTNHDEAVQYFFDIHIEGEEFKRACRRLGQIVGNKSTAEYGKRNLTKREAEDMYLQGERFADYVFSFVLKGFSRRV